MLNVPDFSAVKGVIFDLDGTLIESSLDFKKMRDDIGCPQTQDILEFIDALPNPADKQAAEAVVLQHELDDAQSAKWLPVGLAMIEQAQSLSLPMAIVTRNCHQAAHIKLTNNQAPINFILTREDAPPKPDPTALLMVAEEWGIAPEELMYVGDFRYDKEAAINAGMQWHLV